MIAVIVSSHALPHTKLRFYPFYTKILNPLKKNFLQIHDELIFEVRDDLAQSCAQDIKNIMENVYKLNVPLKCGVCIGKNLAELK